MNPEGPELNPGHLWLKSWAHSVPHSLSLQVPMWGSCSPVHPWEVRSVHLRSWAGRYRDSGLCSGSCGDGRLSS